MSRHNQRLGAWGEQRAVEYLLANGCELLARNVRTPYGEIDIIARRADVILFVEVKTLAATKDFFPEHNITARKAQHMLACADHYAAENEINHWQIDVIAIEGDPNAEAQITYFENAIS